MLKHDLFQTLKRDKRLKFINLRISNLKRILKDFRPCLLNPLISSYFLTFYYTIHFIFSNIKSSTFYITLFAIQIKKSLQNKFFHFSISIIYFYFLIYEQCSGKVTCWSVMKFTKHPPHYMYRLVWIGGPLKRGWPSPIVWCGQLVQSSHPQRKGWLVLLSLSKGVARVATQNRRHGLCSHSKHRGYLARLPQLNW